LQKRSENFLPCEKEQCGGKHGYCEQNVTVKKPTKQHVTTQQHIKIKLEESRLPYTEIPIFKMIVCRKKNHTRQKISQSYRIHSDDVFCARLDPQRMTKDCAQTMESRSHYVLQK
jgi:hypothetical protein